MMHYVRAQPTKVFVMEFSGHTEISDRTLQFCEPFLSDECELLSEDNPFDQTDIILNQERVHPPRICAANIENGKQ